MDVMEGAVMKFFLIDALKSQMVYASWWYYFSKFTEFMDTVRKLARSKFLKNVRLCSLS